jgi:Terminase RNaseH-like domain/TAT (twin-arginine translocation) pathway signal sequence
MDISRRDFLQTGATAAVGAVLPKSSKFIVQVSWDEVPHLSASAKAEILKDIPPFQRDARSRGIPQLGAGAIYTIPVADITIPDLKVIPAHWKRAYGFDVGWNWTAAVWAAWDETQDIVYLYNGYKRGQAEPVVHAAAMKARGAWIPGVIDPAAQGRLQDDGAQMIELYRKQGLNIEPADHAVETGIFEVWNRLTTGRLKVFASMAEWFAEYSLYRRNERGQIVKENDHLMDATRYLLMSGLVRAITEPAPPPLEQQLEYSVGYGGIHGDLGWLGT